MSDAAAIAPVARPGVAVPRFTVLVPARMASSRLPGKPLLEIGGLPMVVRVARQAAASAAVRVVVAADHADIVDACVRHGVDALLTRTDHATGSDRIAEACSRLGLSSDDIVVNVQGDEPLIEPALIDACARLLAERPDCVMSTAAHAVDDADALASRHVVKVVLDRQQRALYFSRAAIPCWRDAPDPLAVPVPAPLHHIGLYAYRAAYLLGFAALAPSPLEEVEALEQLRVLWHGDRIAVHVSALRPGAGVDTPADLARVRALFA